MIANESFARDLGRDSVSGCQRIVLITSGSSDSNTTLDQFDHRQAGRPRCPGAHVGGPSIRPSTTISAFATSIAGSLAFTILGNDHRLDLELSALQQEGRGEVISNPRVVTSNQREAVIRQGQEVGYVTVTGGQSNGVPPRVQFKDVLLELKVTPTITNDGRVFLSMNVKKDEIEGFIDLGAFGAVPQTSPSAKSTPRC